MHAIQDPELIDRQIVDVVLPQHGPLPTRQCAQRSLERPLELAPVDTLDVIELGVAGMADVPQQLVVLPASLAVGAAAALQRLANRHDADPAAQVAAPRIVVDPRAHAVAHQHAAANILLDIVDRAGVEPHREQHSIEAAQTAIVEHGKSALIAPRARAGEIQVSGMQLMQRTRRRQIRTTSLAQVGDEHIGRQPERGTSALRRLDDVADYRVEVRRHGLRFTRSSRPPSARLLRRRVRKVSPIGTVTAPLHYWVRPRKSLGNLR